MVITPYNTDKVFLPLIRNLFSTVVFSMVPPPAIATLLLFPTLVFSVACSMTEKTLFPDGCMSWARLTLVVVSSSNFSVRTVFLATVFGVSGISAWPLALRRVLENFAVCRVKG